jgi:NTE family protein
MSDQRTALVLGGGGITGIAWEIGLLAGLADAGTDLSGADLVVGTSAGSVVGALVTGGAKLRELYERQLAPATGEKAARLNRATLAQFGWAMLRSRGRDVEFRRRIGALALAAEKAGLTPSEQERLDVIGERLAGTQWPDRQLLTTAVDAETGEFRTFDRDSGVSLLQAVAASCAVPGVYPPVTIDGRRYVDGGMRSAANADLALGYDRLVVLAPIPRGGAHGQRRRPGDRAGVPGRRGLARRRQPEGHRPQRPRPRGPGTLGGGRPGPGDRGGPSGRRGLGRLT